MRVSRFGRSRICHKISRISICTAGTPAEVFVSLIPPPLLRRRYYGRKSCSLGNQNSLMEALIPSAETDSEGFCSQAKTGKRRNTACISRFSVCGMGAKDPLLSRRRLIQSFLLYARAAPRAWHWVMASASGDSWQMTLGCSSCAPSARQVSSQVRIHSPSPQP